MHGENWTHVEQLKSSEERAKVIRIRTMCGTLNKLICCSLKQQSMSGKISPNVQEQVSKRMQHVLSLIIAGNFPNFYCDNGLKLQVDYSSVSIIFSDKDHRGGDGSFRCFRDSVQEDLLLSYGYKEGLKSLVHHFPRCCQCFLISATSSTDMVKIASEKRNELDLVLPIYKMMWNYDVKPTWGDMINSVVKINF